MYAIRSYYAGLPRQRARLVDAARRDVERGHVHALPRQPDAVAPFAVGHAQGAAAGDETGLLRREERVRRGAEDVVITSYSIHYTKLYDAQFPLGVDIFLTCGSTVIGLPRGILAEG